MINRLMIVLCLVFVAAPVWACESFEKCMELAEKADFDTHKNAYSQMVIAYELRAIHEELKINKDPNSLESRLERMRDDKTISLSGEKCEPSEMGWDGACHLGDMDEYAHSKECAPPIIGNPTWKKKVEKDGDVIYYKPGCYQLNNGKESK